MFRKRLMIAGLLLAATILPARAEPGPTMAAQSSIPAMPGGPAFAIARIVRGILSYTRWPAQPATIRFCVAGTPRFGANPAGAGTGLAAMRVGAAARAEDCDALYLGAVPGPVRSALLARMRGRQVVTIDEADPGCRSGAMFCLRIGAAEIGMDLNLDAVSRSGVRIDPRVLRLTHPAGAAR
jgi:YfiR/HmsC-like